MDKTELNLYEIFVRSKRGLSHQHAGSVYASNNEQALQLGRDCYLRRSEGTSIWAVPSNQIISSSVDDVDSFCGPMEDKEYRKAESYHIPKEVKDL